MIHILMVAITAHPSTGALSNVMVPSAYAWYPPASWLLQVMPLFFVVGGCASAISWSRKAAAGTTGPTWVRARLLRLILPAAVLWASLATAAAVALALGVPRGWVAVALQGLGMHLWFVGAYTLCLAAVPVLHGLHRRRPALSIGALVVLCAAVEVLRIAAQQPWWGLLGFAPVWLAIQQIGFFRQGGSFRRAPRARLLGIMIAGTAALAGLTALPWWGEDALSTLNPPTLCMVVLGLVQACALELLSPALRRLMTQRPAQAVAWVVGSRATTLYLWHLPVIVTVMAAWWLLGGPDPVPGSAQWWLWRVPIAIVCWVLILLAVRPLSVVERLAGPRADRTPVSGAGIGWGPVLAASGLVITTAALEVRFLLSPVLVLSGAAAMVVAVLLLRRTDGG